MPIVSIPPEPIPKSFNIFNQLEMPQLILCNPNRDQWFSLPLAYNAKNTFRYNAFSEIEFDYPESDDGSNTIDPAYAFLRGKMVIYVKDSCYYVIQNAKENLGGAVPTKHITALSLESEMLFRRITGFTGTYQFSDLLNIVLSIIPTWTVDSVDASLDLLYRTFRGNNNTTVYNFLTSDMEKAYGCVFEFNTYAKTVSAYTNIVPAANTNVFLSFDNLISNIEFNEVTEELCTGLYCYGGESLDIRYVNPLGSAVIYDFSYFKTTEWMTQGLIDALDTWEGEVTTQQPIYAGLLVDLEISTTNRTNMVIDITDSLGALASAELVRDAILAEVPPGSTVAIDAEIYTIKTSITGKYVDIALIQTAMDITQASLRKIVHGLYFSSQISYNAFTNDVNTIQAELDNIEATWRNVYTADSTYPDFSPALLTSTTPSIVTAIDTAQVENTTLLDAIVAGFVAPGQPIPYPFSNANLITLTGYINQEITTLNTLNSLYQSLIPSTDITMQINGIIEKLTSYLEIVYYPGNMTTAQYLELTSYIYENTYTNSNITVTGSMTPQEIQVQSQYLYDQSIVVLGKTAQPRYEFSGSYSNFLAVQGFSSFVQDLSMGQVINIRKDDGAVINAVLLEMSVNYSDPTDFSMTFGNSYRLDNSKYIYGDVLGSAAQLGSVAQ